MSQAPRPPASPTATRPMSKAPPPSSQPNLTLLLVAMCLGLVAAIAHVWRVEQVRTAAEQKSVTIYKVTRTLEPGDTVKDKDLRATSVPAAFDDFYSGAILPGDLSTVMGKRVRRRVAEGSPLTHLDFTGGGTGDSLGITRGKVLVVLPVSTDTAPPILSPEMRVNIAAAITPRGGTLTVMRVMEAVRVVAVGARTKDAGDVRRSRSYSTVTIEVEPKEAAILNTIKRYLPDEEFIIEIRAAEDPTREIITGGINQKVLGALGIDAN